MIRTIFACGCVAIVTLFMTIVEAQEPKGLKPLAIGDALPAIGKRVNWLKGDKLESFSKGKVYVIDLWATWCAPCIEMMPHTSDIADRYAKHGVQIIGLALDPGTATATKDFIKTHAQNMRYVICEDIDGQMKTEYITRTGTAGIPTVLIVNKNGILCWIGHPRNMGGPLAEIVLETYDVAAAKRRSNRQLPVRETDANTPATAGNHNTPRSSAGADREKLSNIFERKDGDAMVKLAESMMGNPARLVNALGIKGKGLYHQGKFKQANLTFNSICHESGEFKTQVLCGAAEFLVTHYQDNPDRNLKLAISLAEAAVANRGGQQWPATGTLAFVMDVVEFHTQGNRKEDVKEHKLFSQKLEQHKELRAGKPRESHGTARNRQTLLGQQAAQR
jgi:thiol-disulfide isomerase/thioredoxin